MSKMLNKVISAELESKFEGACGFVAVDYQGLNSSEEYEFRKSLRGAGQTVLVVPNRLAKLVVAPAVGLELNGDKETYEVLFRGPTALVVGHEKTEDEVIAGAKAVVEFLKKNKDKSLDCSRLRFVTWPRQPSRSLRRWSTLSRRAKISSRRAANRRLVVSAEG